MNIFKAIQQGFFKVWICKRMVLLLYIAIFLMALCIAYPLKKLLESTVGHSLMVQDLMKGFDYEFFNDFNNAYGVGWTPIFDQSIVVVLLFLLLYVFFSGGIYAVLTQVPKSNYRAIFWANSAQYFWKILRLSLFFLVIHSLVFALFALLFYALVNGELQNEGVISTALKIVLPCYYLVALFFFVWQDYSKYFLVTAPKKWIISTLVESFRFLRAHLMNVYFLYLINMLFWGVLVFINYRITLLIDIESYSTILLSFFVSQLFLLIRIFIKLINIGSIVSYTSLD